ncbi:unnamed protein product [Peronospora belbahrii]|nr:unnamed protein product [Peronospora belbahrii]
MQLVVMPPTDDDLTDDYTVASRFAASAEEEEVEENAEDEVVEENAYDKDGSEEPVEGGEEGFDGDVLTESDHPNENKATQDKVREGNEKETIEEEGKSDKVMEKQLQLHDAEEAAGELPFVFECPESPEELGAIFKKHARESYEKRGLILERIVTYYNPRLSVENKSKMKRFFAVIVRQFLIFAARYAAHKHDLDLLTKTMYTLAQEMSETAGIVARELLRQLFKRLHKRASICAWPTLPELLLFKALTCIFPTSDLRHNVVSPMETLLGESLARGTVRSPQEATQALFAASLSLDMMRSKERFMPEVVTFLTHILRAFVTSGVDESKDNSNDCYTSIHWLRRDLLKWVCTRSDGKMSVLPRVALADSSSCSGAQVLSSLLGLVDISSAQYASLPSFDELFYPLYLLLHALVKQLEDIKIFEVNVVIWKLHTRLKSCWKTRRPLRLQSFRPMTLPTFAPQFDESYTARKDKMAPKDTAQLKQLQRQVKRARKSAARELRRDTEFIEREKQKEEKSRLLAKEEKQKEIRHWLEEENATFNQQVRKGGNMLKGGGSLARIKRPF